MAEIIFGIIVLLITAPLILPIIVWMWKGCIDMIRTILDK